MPKTDVQYLRDLAKSIEFFDRWRAPITAVVFLVLVSAIGAMAWVGNGVLNQNGIQQFGPKTIFLVAAFIVGVTVGMHLHGLVKFFIAAVFGGFRTERLLLKLADESRTQESSDRTR